MNGRDEQTLLPRFHLLTPPFSPPSSAFLTMAMIIIIILINKIIIIIITMIMRTVLTTTMRLSRVTINMTINIESAVRWGARFPSHSSVFL